MLTKIETTGIILSVLKLYYRSGRDFFKNIRRTVEVNGLWPQFIDASLSILEGFTEDVLCEHRHADFVRDCRRLARQADSVPSTWGFSTDVTARLVTLASMVSDPGFDDAMITFAIDAEAKPENYESWTQLSDEARRIFIIPKWAVKKRALCQALFTAYRACDARAKILTAVRKSRDLEADCLNHPDDPRRKMLSNGAAQEALGVTFDNLAHVMSSVAETAFWYSAGDQPNDLAQATGRIKGYRCLIKQQERVSELVPGGLDAQKEVAAGL